MEKHKPENVRERYGYLPRSARLIWEAVGEEKMLMVVQTLGGRRLRISSARMRRANILLTVLSIDDAEAVRRHLWASGIDRFEVPTLGYTRFMQRARQIVELTRQDMTTREIAKRLNVTERTVFYAIRREHDRNQQP